MPRANEPATPSSSASFMSDKENHTENERRVSGQKRPSMEPPTSSTASKRRRMGLSDRDGQGEGSGQDQRQNLDKVTDKQYYDPDQSMAERRELRKGFRDLSRDLADSRNDYLASESTGITETIRKANDLFDNVKQTSDATLDSRLLVQVGDLSARRSKRMQLGGAAGGINVDEFVSKCITFMRKGPSESEAATLYPPDSTQRQRRRRQRAGESDGESVDEGDDDGDALNWEWLGRKIAFPVNRRPPVSAFLLGPLAVQKKVRKATQRTARQRLNPADAVKPEELKANEIERSENSNLTTLCKMILDLLGKTVEEGTAAVEDEIGDKFDDMSDEAIREVMERHNVADDGGSCLYRFAFNPQSFGQTVENLFYICFLIRDGRVGLGVDSKGLTTLHPAQPSTPAQIQEQGTVKNQGVFHLDFETWEEVVSSFGIARSVIPHRAEDENHRNMKGWYA